MNKWQSPAEGKLAATFGVKSKCQRQKLKLGTENHPKFIYSVVFDLDDVGVFLSSIAPWCKYRRSGK